MSEREVDKTIVQKLAVGDRLYASCSAEMFGEILSIDAENLQCDILVYRPTDLMHWFEGDVDATMAPGAPPVTVTNLPINYISDDAGYLEKDERGQFTSLYVAFETPWDGCNRCVASFCVVKQEPGNNWREYVYGGS